MTLLLVVSPVVVTAFSSISMIFFTKLLSSESAIAIRMILLELTSQFSILVADYFIVSELYVINSHLVPSLFVGSVEFIKTSLCIERVVN